MNKEIFIATPMYGGICNGQYTESIIKLYTHLISIGFNVKYYTIYNESLITRARNILTEKFLREESDYLLFIDSDQSFDYEGIVEMINYDKDIIGSLVPMKKINWNGVRYAFENNIPNIQDYTGYFNVNVKEGTFTNDFSLFEVESIGSGLILIKKEVILKLKDNLPKYKHNSTNILGIKDNDIITEFWSTCIDENGILLSEDYNFCRISKINGYKIYASNSAKVKHFGNYEFSGKI